MENSFERIDKYHAKCLLDNMPSCRFEISQKLKEIRDKLKYLI